MSRLTSLIAHPGYQFLMEVAQSQIETRINGIILTPLNTYDETLKQEYAKGEVAGIQLFKSLAEARVRDLSERIQDVLKTEEKDNEDEDFGS